MAAEENTLRDGIESVRQPFPPGSTVFPKVTQFDHSEAPAQPAGSFLVKPETSVEAADESMLDLLCSGPECLDAQSITANRLRYSLPPQEMRLPGYRNRDEIDRNRIPTPVDARGIVDVDELIRRVKNTINPAYRWPGNSDQHHTLWPAYRYGIFQAYRPDIDAVSFRNLAMNKIWVPRIFHNWIHIVTEPPEIPAAEVMQKSIDEWIVVRGFFGSVKETTGTMRLYERERVRRKDFDRPLNGVQEQLLNIDMQRRLGGVVMHLRQLEGIDLERWLISEDMGVHAAAGQIGDLVLRGWQRRTRAVRRTSEERPVWRGLNHFPERKTG